MFFFFNSRDHIESLIYIIHLIGLAPGKCLISIYTYLYPTTNCWVPLFSLFFPSHPPTQGSESSLEDINLTMPLLKVFPYVPIALISFHLVVQPQLSLGSHLLFSPSAPQKPMCSRHIMPSWCHAFLPLHRLLLLTERGTLSSLPL